MDTELQEWLEGRPQVIKDLAEKYPPGQYIMLDNDVYGLATGGTLVALYSYSDDGTIQVAINRSDFSDEAKEHENKLMSLYGHSVSPIPEDGAVLVDIDPKYMEPV